MTVQYTQIFPNVLKELYKLAFRKRHMNMDTIIKPSIFILIKYSK
jgi:hypothetical protein